MRPALRPRPWLRPLAWLFRGAVFLRNHAFDVGLLKVATLPVPVLSVGNLAAGGTGKTPLVAFLAESLARRGWRPAIVSRGHGGLNARRRGSPPLLVSAGDGRPPLASAADAGDEPLFLALSLPQVPVVVCRRRWAGGKLALEARGVNLIILDDGFQHRRLARQVDLVALDAADPLAGGALLPAGGLREPLAALHRAHGVVITRAGDPVTWERTRDLVRRQVPGMPVHRATLRPTGLRAAGPGTRLPGPAPASLAGVRVGAFAGIAHPGQFRATLEELGAVVCTFRAFPDHGRLDTGLLEAEMQKARDAGAHLTITTAKDAARLGRQVRNLSGLAILDVVMEPLDPEGLVQWIAALCGPASSRGGLDPGG